MAWYEYPSNFSGGQEVTGLGSYIYYINEITNNSLSIGFLIIIWLAMFVFGQVSGSRKAIGLASFITFIFSIYFVRLGMITTAIPIALIFLTIIGIILGSKDNQGL